MASLVTIETYFDQSEAVAAKSFLEAYGCYATLPDRYMAANAWHFTVAIQGIRLCVLDSDVKKAKSLLASVDRGDDTKGRLSIKDVLMAVIAIQFAVPHPVRRIPTTDDGDTLDKK